MLNQIASNFITTYEQVRGQEIPLFKQREVFLEEVEELKECFNYEEDVKWDDTFAGNKYREWELKEICDVIFSLCVYARFIGYNIDEALWEVADNNMSKFKDAKFDEQGKLMKNADYVPPCMDPYIYDSGLA